MTAIVEVHGREIASSSSGNRIDILALSVTPLAWSAKLIPAIFRLGNPGIVIGSRQLLRSQELDDVFTIWELGPLPGRSIERHSGLRC